jgi:PAS domain S-box-containing protein
MYSGMTNQTDLTRDFVRLNTGFQHPQEARAWLAAIVSSSTDAIVGKTTDGVVTSFNPAAERLFGYRADEIIGKQIRILVPGDRQEEEDHILARIAAGEQVDHYETIRLNKNGSPIDVSVSVSPVRNASGGIIGAAKIARDISGRKRAEEAARAVAEEATRKLAGQRAELQLILDATPAFIFYKDRENRFVRVNQAFAGSMGLPKEELEGRSMLDLYPVEQAEAFWRDDKEVMATGCPKLNIVEPYQSQSGERWARTSKVPCRDAAGNIIGVIGFSTDITDLKRADAVLRESEESERARRHELETILSAIPAAVLISEDRDCARMWANPAGRGMLRIPEGANASKSAPEAEVPTNFEAYSPDGRHLKPEELPMQMAAATGRPVEAFELELRFKEGDRTLQLGNALPLFAPSGEVRGAVAAFLDITERKRSEDQVRLLLREVNHRAKNMLSIVQAIASQTAAAGYEDFIARFSERIKALATNQDLLVRSQWKGVDLGDLIRAQLAHFESLIGGRIDIAGPPLQIAAEAAQPIAMAMHELATNAGKYGALSNGEGKVNIAWDIGSDETFHLGWTEIAGPRAVSPTRRGFGTTVIADVPETQLDAKISLEFPPSGVTWSLSCLAKNVLEAGSAFGNCQPPHRYG